MTTCYWLLDTVLLESIKESVSGDSQEFGCLYLVFVCLLVGVAYDLLDNVIKADPRGRNPCRREFLDTFVTFPLGLGRGGGCGG